LYEFLKANKFQGITSSLIKRFGYQILKALSLLDSNDIIHCDLKPENILLKNPNHSLIKVIDFGSSCFGDKRLYTYIQSRFYRAPEIILGIPYTTAIDMWSFGCILAELHTGYPLFPGESESEQLLCIMEVLGIPPLEVLAKSTRLELFFNNYEPKITPNSRGKKRLPHSKNLDEILLEADEKMINLIKLCLEWNPDKRISARSALMHEWMEGQNLNIRNNSSRVNSAKPNEKSTPRNSMRLTVDDSTSLIQ
jgi:dual specificity tyrosine-phosphorylation-regulated kinase 2/3/4